MGMRAYAPIPEFEFKVSRWVASEHHDDVYFGVMTPSLMKVVGLEADTVNYDNVIHSCASVRWLMLKDSIRRWVYFPHRSWISSEQHSVAVFVLYPSLSVFECVCVSDAYIVYILIVYA